MEVPEVFRIVRASLGHVHRVGTAGVDEELHSRQSEPRPDDLAGRVVLQLVSRRYERGSIILTSNKTFSEMGQVFGDDVLASAILDRLLHHAEVISINGPSYRLKDRILKEGGAAN